MSSGIGLHENSALGTDRNDVSIFRGISKLVAVLQSMRPVGIEPATSNFWELLFLQSARPVGIEPATFDFGKLLENEIWNATR